MKEADRERYVRWQEYRIQHLGYALNLFLGFAVASIAFAITRPDRVEEVVLAWWIVSLVAGVIAVLSRLIDFRLTGRRIKSDGREYELTTHLAGHATWIAFGVQLAAYCSGAYAFIFG